MCAAVCAVVALLGPIDSHAAVVCADLTYDRADYAQKMDELAERAALPGASWNRYHETIVAGLCRGPRTDVNELVRGGSIPVDEVERMAAVLGTTYQPVRRSRVDRAHADTRRELIELGVCAACSDNIARYVTRKPSSRCAALAKRALDGDSRAIDELGGFPDFCRWAYGVHRSGGR